MNLLREERVLRKGWKTETPHSPVLDHPVLAAAENKSPARLKDLLYQYKAMVDETVRRTCPQTPIKRKAEMTPPGLKIPVFSFQC